MFIRQGMRKVRGLHYAATNAIVPFTASRWAFTGVIIAVYMGTTTDFCADLNTYLVGFYLLMLALSYFLPKGVPDDMDSSFDDDEEYSFACNEAIDPSFDEEDSIN